MADNIERLVLDDSDFMKPMQDVIKATKEADKAMNELNEEISTKNKKASKDFVKSNDDVNKSLKKTAEANRKAAESTKENIKSINLFGTSLGAMSNKIKAFKDGIRVSIVAMKSLNKLSITQKRGIITLTKTVGGGKKAFIAMAKGVNILKRALITSGIGLLVIVLASVAAALTRTQEGMDKLGQATAYVGGAFDVLTEKAAKLGNELIEGIGNGTFWDTLLRNVKEVLDKGVIQSIIELGIEMDEVGTKTAFFAEQFQKLAIEQSKADLLAAKNRSTLEAYKKTAEDTTKTLKQRITATRSAVKIEKEQLDAQLKIAAKILFFTKRDNEERKKSGLTTNLKKENELAAKLFNLKAESIAKTIELQNKENALIKEFNDRLKAAQVKLVAITREIVNVGNELNLISEKDAFDFARQDQINNLKAMRTELEGIAKLTGEDVTGQVEILNEAIDGLANRGFESLSATKLLLPFQDVEVKVGNDTLDDEGNVLAGKIERKIKTKEVVSTIDTSIALDLKIEIAPESEKEFLRGIDSFKDVFEEALDAVFSTKNKEKAKEFLDGIGDLFSNFNSIIEESTQLEVDAIDKELEKLAEKREELQESLDDELADREKGLAGSVGGKKEEVDALIAEEERLQQEKEKIQSEAARRQLLVDTLTQTQSIITSSINIIKGFSQIPIFGLPLGIAAVGTMLAFFAKTKADAFKATKLHTGAGKISDHFGFGERHGETDLPGRGDGYMLVNNKTGKPTNTIISGREMLLPENVSVSNESFFSSMKSGLYNGIDLNDAVSFYMTYRNNPPKSTTNTIIQQGTLQKQATNTKNGQLIPYVDKKGNQKAVYVVIDPSMADGSIIEIKG